MLVPGAKLSAIFAYNVIPSYFYIISDDGGINVDRFAKIVSYFVLCIALMNQTYNHVE